MAIVEEELSPVKYPHIWVDEQNVARLEGSRLKVYQIAIDHVHQGVSAAEIQEQYPHLPMSQIYSALSYYYDHQAEIEADIARRRQTVNDLQMQATDQLTRADLLARLRQRGVSLHPDNPYVSVTDSTSSMVTLYMDEHVPGAITRGLRRRGVDVVTVQEDGRGGTPDPVVLDRAGELQRIVFTNDDDFLVEANRRQERNESFVGVIYIHQEKVAYGPCIDDLEVIAKASDITDYTGRVQYLPL